MTDPSQPEISVVIPAHNESANIGGLIAEVCLALDGVAEYEVVVVDDCSSDGSDRILAALASTNPRLQPLRHERQAGQSTAILSGVRAARGKVIATLDGDGQNDPADIPALLKLYRERGGAGPVAVAGQRVKRRDTWLRRASSRIANRIRAAMLNDDTPDTGCGLKLFERSLFLSLPYFDHMHRFLPALMRRAGADVLQVPVNHRPRGGGTAHYGVWDRLWVGIVDICGVMWLQRRSRPTGAITDLRKGS